MPRSDSYRTDTELPDEVMQQAARWHARLREAGETESEDVQRAQAFETWIAAHPDHKRAFEETKAVWNALALPAARLMDPAAPLMDNDPSRKAKKRKGATSRWRAASFSAAAFAVIAVAAVLQDDALVLLDSDHRTGAGERQEIALMDGGKVTLNSRSAVAIDGRQARLLRGEAWFDVTHDANAPFHVDTDAGRVTVLGTRFGVRLTDEGAEVVLVEGLLDLSTETDRQTLTAGFGAALTGSGVTDPTVIDPLRATAWLRGQAVFENAPLKDVIAALNRHRTVPILIAGGIEEHRISGVFSLDDPDAAVRALEALLPGRVTRITDAFVVLR